MRDMDAGNKKTNAKWATDVRTELAEDGNCAATRARTLHLTAVTTLKDVTPVL